ncbi:MAG TPA: hypothetical protein EYP08_05045 [Pyrodictiaceae archaeon]|nr:hypothetical protein [Pyrodictiaceae archaeon]HIQ56046.1 hypothetical protein [Pyrodictium sp.]
MVLALKVLLWKELRSLLLNPAALASLILIPVIMIASMQFSMKELSKQLSETSVPPVAVVGPGASELAKFLESRGVEVVDDAGRASVTIWAPAHVGEKLEKGEPVTLKIFYRIEKLSATSLKQGMVIGNLLTKLASVEEASQPKISIEVVAELPSGKKLYGIEATTLASILTTLTMPLAFIAIFAFAPAVSSMVRDYAEKTFELILSQPVPRRTIALAKSLAATITGLAQGAVIMGSLFYVMSTTAFAGMLEIFDLLDSLFIAVAIVAEMVFASSLALVASVLLPGPEAMGVSVSLLIVVGFVASSVVTVYGVPLTTMGLLLMSLVPLLGPVVVAAAGLLDMGFFGIIALVARLVETSLMIYLFTKLVSTERSLLVAAKFTRSMGG